MDINGLKELVQAVNHHRNGELQQAARLFETYAEESPRARYSLGCCLYAAGNKEEGQAHVFDAVSAQPGIFPFQPLALIQDTVAELASHGEAQDDEALSVPAKLTLWQAALEIEEEKDEAAARKGYIDSLRRLRQSDRDFSAPVSKITEKGFREAVAPQPIWHSIDLGGDCFLEGARKTSKILSREMLQFNLPDVTNKSVLDIGAWGGFFSFECEHRGAARVRAVDYFSWVTDFHKLNQWAREMREAGKLPDNYHPADWVMDHQHLPGRKPFDLARDQLGSAVEATTSDFMDLNPLTFGASDITLFLGVLYHMTNPFEGLQQIHALTKEVAVIETHATHAPEYLNVPLWEFHSGNAVNRDKTTHWGPTSAGLVAMLEEVGFSKIEVISDPVSRMPFSHLLRHGRQRLVVHAWK